MGCWCETCGITQLPINAGDKVRLFVLVSQTHWKEAAEENNGGGICYSDDLWSPIGPAIQGEYDDYGGIENIVQNDATKLVKARIDEDWIALNKKHEWDEIPEKLHLENYLHFIERGRGFINGYRGKQALGIMMVHEDVYQAMVNFDSIEAHHNWEERSYEYMPMSKGLRIDFEHSYLKMLKLSQELAAEKDEKMRLLMAFREDMYDDRIFSGHRDAGMKVYKKLLQGLAKEFMPLESERVQQVLKDAMEHYRFIIGMSRARKQWVPQSGKGGQNNDLDIYRAIEAGAHKVIEARKKQEEEWGHEPVDAEGYTKWQREHNESEKNKGTDAKEGE